MPKDLRDVWPFAGALFSPRTSSKRSQSESQVRGPVTSAPNAKHFQMTMNLGSVKLASERMRGGKR